MNIWLPDGNLEFLRNHNDLVVLVTKHIGDEAGRMVQELVHLSDINAHKVDSDFKSYESQVESNQHAFEEIGEVLDRMEQQLAAARINKRVLSELCSKTRVLVSNQL
ncbi:hypothetical protein ACE41H_15720 [Paenibacillus enshidis]|uniref:Uncharacterized protein n=1 Tax=Paenibacillus enshidis TaxID=1458439 RepID=A0ABV5AVH2_9BACL